MGCCCGKCSKMSAWLLLAIGVGLLLADVGTWDFWGLSWFTLAFLYLGCTKVAMSNCGACKSGKKKNK